ncbi:leukotriene C4 synthase [Protopterus annectens]|uniref:leukotriene C4 synthase n=1 Tax=Protopterus annectens TaxID=7888 RepID=UPI001CFA8F79|nr:leukotriene C4 synthase [Protopterus annectens]
MDGRRLETDRIHLVRDVMQRRNEGSPVLRLHFPLKCSSFITWSAFKPSVHNCSTTVHNRTPRLRGSEEHDPSFDMHDQIAFLGAVTVLAVLQQAYFFLQVIYARRKYKVPPPTISGPLEFERIFRAQVNCSEYLPLFMAVLWVAGFFFSQVTAASCGLLYLYARHKYFKGYSNSSQERLSPIYFSSGVLWILIAMSGIGVLSHILSPVFGLEIAGTLLTMLRKSIIGF